MYQAQSKGAPPFYSFVSFVLAVLAGIAGPLVVALGLCLWFESANTVKVMLDTLPMSTLLTLVGCGGWFCVPKPEFIPEALGRVAIVLFVTTALPFEAIMLPKILVMAVNHTDLTNNDLRFAGFHSLWGVMCGTGAVLMLHYRERRTLCGVQQFAENSNVSKKVSR